MTHVFVAPHPDDVALSCGGLIASLRELGQNVTIITVFSGEDVNGDVGLDGMPAYEREALGFGSKTMWPSTEAFNRSSILPDYPLVPAWVAEEDRLESTQSDADAAAKRFWQRSSWYRRASIRAESLAGQAVIDELPTQGAVVTEEILEAAAAGDQIATSADRGRALRLLRRGVDRVPRSTGCHLPRLRDRGTAPWPAAR